MRTSLAIFILGSVFAVAAFGLLTMSNMNEGGHTGCIAATASGAPCPANLFGALAFHINSFESASTAVLFGFALLLLAFAYFAFERTREKERQSGSLYARLGERISPAPVLRTLRSWLSFHVNSPNAA